MAFDCAERQLPLTLDLALSLQIGRGFADPYDTVGEFACSTRRANCFEYLVGEDGQRGESTLLAFACAWTGANEPSHLNLAHGRLALGSVAVICDGQRLTLAPVTREIAEAGDGDLRLRYLALFGLEALQPNLTKLYHNVVIETENLVGFDSCRVEWSATAYSTGDELFDRDEAVADALVYPYFVVEADLSREGELICDADVHELPVRADAVLFGTVPEYPPLPARCFEFDGLLPSPTGHPGCE